ncbi:MAG: VOC family protein [Alphaproteobacteria bacterium]|nr:VOC family protein [Alphaproteobacteria bacterium]
MSVKSQPIIAVRDVRASARWYAHILGSEETTGSPPSDHDHIYRRIYVGGELVLQLHAWDEEDHPNLTGRDRAPVGHGVLIWFEVDDYTAAAARARGVGADVIEEGINPNGSFPEMWLHDPDGYVVVLAGPDGSADPEPA